MNTYFNYANVTINEEITPPIWLNNVKKGLRGLRAIKGTKALVALSVL